MITNYKDLQVWQKAMDLVEHVYILTNKIPKEEQFGLISQMRRFSVSIPSNIAEGYGRHSTGNYIQFLSIARGSLLELDTQINLCVRLKYFSSIDSESATHILTEVAKMLSSLIVKVGAN